MRHAKSAWPSGVADAKRPLAKRGRKDAKVASHIISHELPRPDLVIMSPSKRTRQTVKVLEDFMGRLPAQSDKRLYAADWWDLLDVIHGVDDEIEILMLVGHSPGLEDMVREVATDGPPEDLARMRAKFPTAAIAVIRSASRWADWGAGSGVLDRFIVPRAKKHDKAKSAPE